MDIELGGLSWIPHPRVQAISTVRSAAGFSKAPFDRFNLGSRCGDDPDAVERNRAMLGPLFDLPARPNWMRQVHGISVVRFDGVASGKDELEADAAITAMPGVVLAILSADCLPVLFCSEDGSAVGAAHAGWRGLAAGVLEATIASMRISPDSLLAWLGPAAGPNAYEVGEEVRDAFVSRDRATEAMFVPTRPGHWLVDLYGLAIRRLMGAGMPRTAIHGGGLCTISDPQRFFSYRRDVRTGRMASLIWINRVLAGA